jgi:hypothetical protein
VQPWRDFCSSPGRQVCAPTIANGGSQKRITNCTKPSSIMGHIVGKPITRATSYAKRVNTAGLVLIGGGTKTVIAGALTATGMTTITIVTIANIRRANSTIMSSSFEAQQRKLCAFPFNCVQKRAR